MIVLFVHISDADALQNLLQRAGFLSLTRQIAPQLTIERVAPTDALPVLSVRFGDETVGEDVYDDGLASAMYEAMQDGARRHQVAEREAMPLFAAEIEHVQA